MNLSRVILFLFLLVLSVNAFEAVEDFFTGIDVVDLTAVGASFDARRYSVIVPVDVDMMVASFSFRFC